MKHENYIIILVSHLFFINFIARIYTALYSEKEKKYHKSFIFLSMSKIWFTFYKYAHKDTP